MATENARLFCTVQLDLGIGGFVTSSANAEEVLFVTQRGEKLRSIDRLQKVSATYVSIDTIVQ